MTKKSSKNRELSTFDDDEPDWAGTFESIEVFLKKRISAHTSDEELKEIVDEATDLSEEQGAYGADFDVLYSMARDMRSEK